MASSKTAPLDTDLLLTALGGPKTAFVLGAGASAPDVPTIGEIPDRLAHFASHLGSFPAGPLPDSPLRTLIAPLIERARRATDFSEVWPGMMTPGTIAVLLEDIIARAHRRPMTQYEVFRLFSVWASVISFNWDGLALSRCPQITRLHPHGSVPPRALASNGVIEALEYSQEDDRGWLRDYVLPDIVMLGEEERAEYNAVREQVFQLWLRADAIVVIGYSFGLGTALRYDRAWLDAFVAATKENPSVPVHIIDPNAARLRAELGDQIGEVRVFAWPYAWNILSRAMLAIARKYSASSALQLQRRWPEIVERADELAEIPVVAS
jgi:hypothetical protein